MGIAVYYRGRDGFGSVEGENVIWVSKMRRGQSTPLLRQSHCAKGFRFMSLRTCASRWRGGDSVYIIKAGDAEGNPKDDRPLLFRTTTTKRTPRQRARLQFDALPFPLGSFRSTPLRILSFRDIYPDGILFFSLLETSWSRFYTFDFFVKRKKHEEIRSTCE